MHGASYKNGLTSSSVHRAQRPLKHSNQFRDAIPRPFSLACNSEPIQSMLWWRILSLTRKNAATTERWTKFSA